MRRLRDRLAPALLLAGALMAATAAPAAARVGFFFGYSGGFYPAPAPWYYAPPPPAYYYVPPPAYAYPSYGYVAPPGPATPLAQSCRAGAWSCPLGSPARPGDACSCPTPNGPAWGRVGG